MYSEVTWDRDYSTGSFVNYTIFRSLNKEDVYNVENQLEVIDNIDTVSYLDKAAVGDTKYYYGVQTVTSLGTSRSRPTLGIFFQYPGDGGVEIKSGNYEFGYIGEVDSYFLTAAESIIRGLIDKVGTATTTNSISYFANGSKFIPVNKWVKDGKIFITSVANYYGPGALNPGAQRKAFYDGVIREIISNPRIIEFNGTRYKLGILTKDECMVMRAAPVALYSGRPKSIAPIQLRSIPMSHWIQSSGPEMAYQLNGASVSDITEMSAAAAVPDVAWYFTPISPE